MRRHTWLGALFLILIAGVRGSGGEPTSCEPVQPHLLQRVSPVGGWCPYGHGPLCWWDPHCFPCGGGPDDYCRKKLPCVCWPPYPPWYLWGPPAAAVKVSGWSDRVCPH
jgi:hypothetical protein